MIMPHSERMGFVAETIAGAALMTRVYSRKPVQSFASVAVTVNVNVPAVVGVPSIRPELLIGNISVGSVPI